MAKPDADPNFKDILGSFTAPEIMMNAVSEPSANPESRTGEKKYNLSYEQLINDDIEQRILQIRQLIDSHEPAQLKEARRLIGEMPPTLSMTMAGSLSDMAKQIQLDDDDSEVDGSNSSTAAVRKELIRALYYKSTLAVMAPEAKRFHNFLENKKIQSLVFDQNGELVSSAEGMPVFGRSIEGRELQDHFIALNLHSRENHRRDEHIAHVLTEEERRELKSLRESLQAMEGVVVGETLGKENVGSSEAKGKINKIHSIFSKAHEAMQALEDRDATPDEQAKLRDVLKNDIIKNTLSPIADPDTSPQRYYAAEVEGTVMADRAQNNFLSGAANGLKKGKNSVNIASK